MNKLMAVRKEFGEPFVDVVRGFAELGYSRTATAEILDFNRAYFYALLTRFDLGKHFLPQSEMREECRQGGKSKPRTKAKRYTDEEILQEVRRHKRHRLFAAKSSISSRTVLLRFGSWAKAMELAGVRPSCRGRYARSEQM